MFSPLQTSAKGQSYNWAGPLFGTSVQQGTNVLSGESASRCLSAHCWQDKVLYPCITHICIHLHKQLKGSGP